MVAAARVQTVHPIVVGLDLIRFAAAAMVMWFHLSFWSWLPPTGDARMITHGLMKFPELIPSSWFGWVGVQIFFVLSGFVIAGSSASATPTQFFRGRFLRLAPAAWICGSLTMLVLLLVRIHPLDDLGFRYMRTLAFWPVGPWVDDVYWTLGIEIAFYGLVWTVLRFARYSMMVYLLSGLGFLSSTFWIVSAALKALIGYDVGSLGIDDRVLDLTLIHHGCYFAIGGLLWLLLMTRASPWPWLVIAGCILGGICEISLPAITRASFLGNPAMAATPLILWLASLALIVASVRLNTVDFVQANAAFARRIGLSTYPLYLLHDVIGASIMRFVFELTDNRWLALAIAIGSVCLLSWIVALYVEKALRMQIRLLLGWVKLGRPASSTTLSG